MAALKIFSALFLFSQIFTSTTADDYRLPTTLSPYHYEVHVNIPPETFTATSNEFNGTVVIYFNALEETSQIRLHSSARFISIINITLNNRDIPAANYSVNATTDILTIQYPDGLEVDTVYAIKIEYIGQLSVVDMYGAYKSSYVGADGATHYLATTQFQATHARRAFPSWDEPLFKATFTILITYPEELLALSNTPGTIQRTINNQSTIQFDRTPVMSTYLVAFVVSDFTCTDAQSVGSTPHRICSRPETEDIRGWAADVGSATLRSFNEYTQFDYNRSISKLDQLAIPDFAAGAMENWGLITYRETGLLWDPEESSNSNKQSIAAVIAHELTHMWFGNLVTCRWWSETFLNEGFARLFQYYVLDDVLPDWQLRKQFLVVVLQPVFEADSYLTSQPLQSPASTASQVSAKFGSITYSKGASIFRMVQNILGFENFRSALRNYLVEFQYRAVEPDDLWTSLGNSVDTSDLPASLNDIMRNWVVNSGYPLLTVSLNGRNILVTQERFLLSGTDTEAKWYVPVSFTTSVDENKFQSTAPEGWVTPDYGLAITLPAGASWIILNTLQTGYYRVNYDLALWNNISDALFAADFSGIPEENRAQIVDDAFNLAKVDELLYSRVFDIVDFLKNDISYFPWYPAFNGFNFLIRRIGTESRLGRAIVGHLSELMEKLAESVPLNELDENDHIYTLKQVQANTWACRLGKENCVNAVRDIYREWRQNSVRPNKNLKSIVYCNALRYSNDTSDWEFLWQTYLSTDLASERATLISALGCTEDVDILNRYLLMSITPDSGIRLQDAYSVFSAVSGGTPIGTDVAFDFLTQNYVAIENTYQSMNALENLITGIAERFVSEDHIAKLEHFIETADINESFRDASVQALATAQANLAWLEEYRDDLHDFYGIEDDDDDDDDDDEDDDEDYETIDVNESTRPEYRIPRTIVPEHYEIHLNVTHDVFTASGQTFGGTVVIHIKTRRNTNQIRLHASAIEIDITEITLNNDPIPSANYQINSTTDILTIIYEPGLETARPYQLRIDYIGTFGNNLRGFYKSSYVNPEGLTRYLVTTQFEPVHARRAFPSFDEPSFKATFQLLITHPINLTATSNTPGTIVQTNTPADLRTIQFNTSPVMSTYLLAFVVSDFTCTTGDSIGTAPYRVCSRPYDEQDREWAVDVGPKILSSLNRYTGHNYDSAIEKMDQFAIPDFSAGAMENWGLVTYRENYLLWNPAVSTNSLKQSIATVIAHEFGHMWYGNLVTCAWWSEIFLNEGFATFFEFYSTHDVLPDWELDKQFVVRVHQPVLLTDSYITAQALQSQASTPAEISNKFSSISYSKGGSILRMVEHILGPDNFKAGLNHYLEVNKFGNTKPEDLWNALGEFVDDSVSRLPANLTTIMEPWIRSSGYPVVNVRRSGSDVILTQERFLISGEDFSSRWYVPISYTTSVDENRFVSTAPRAWLTPTSNLTLSWPAAADWIILNNHETAFYRIQYENSLWDSIAVALRAENFSGIPELNRAQIVDDLFDFVRIDAVTYTRVFTAIEFLEDDTTFSPWYSVASEFTTLISRIGQLSHIGRAMTEHVLRLTDKLYNSVPLSVIDEDNHLYTLKQILTSTLVCRLGNERCGEHARDHYRQFRFNATRPPKNIGSLIYCNGIRHSLNHNDWHWLFDRHIEPNYEADRAAFITALGCSRDEELLLLYLGRTIDAYSDIRVQDVPAVFAAVYENHHGVDVALRFVRDNYNAIYNRVQSWNTVSNIIRGIGGQVRHQSQVVQLEDFLEVAPSQIQSAILDAINSGRQSLSWVDSYQADFFEYYGLEPETTTVTPSTTTTVPTTTTTPSTTTTPAITTPPSTAPTTPDGATDVGASLLLTLILAFITKCYVI